MAIELRCAKCGTKLTMNLAGRIIPCASCISEAEEEKGVSDFDEGYDQGHNDAIEEMGYKVVRKAFKKGYEECYLTLTGDYISEWQLRFITDRIIGEIKNEAMGSR